MERDLTWTTLKSEKIYSETWMNIRADTCEKPDGNIVTPYYVYEFPEWVCAVALTKDNKVVMERQYRHALGVTSLEIPGGCVDETDASFEVAIARELLEETGYRFERYEYLGSTSANPSTNTNLNHLFLATGGELVQEQKLDAGEDIEVFTVSLDEFVQMVRDQKIVQSMHLAGIYRALEKLGKLRFL